MTGSPAKEKLELEGIAGDVNKKILLEVIDEDVICLGSKYSLVKNTGGKSAGEKRLITYSPLAPAASG
jgi:hypothetical protein